MRESENFNVEKQEDITMEQGNMPMARGIAARCWCDPRVADREMDVELGEVFAEKIAEYIAALQWCSGSSDFGHKGQAREGWLKIVKPLIKEQ